MAKFLVSDMHWLLTVVKLDFHIVIIRQRQQIPCIIGEQVNRQAVIWEFCGFARSSYNKFEKRKKERKKYKGGISE